MNAIRHAHQGLSLVEVMVAMAILVVGLMSLMGAMTTANEVKNRQRSQGLALEAVQAEIEKIQAMTYTQVASTIPLEPSGLAFPVAGLRLRTGDPVAGGITRRADSTSNLLHLTFTVNWVDVQGPCSLSIDYFHTNRGS
jgi:prepilin-type N-terminal cleavage/methylation domain-containing protein